jgi:hypothetical protein
LFVVVVSLDHPILVGSEAKCRRYLSSILMIRSLVGLTTGGKIGTWEEVVSFPFLENDNLKDLLLVHLLLVKRPYKATYGATIKAWDDIALQLRNEKHPETGELLFGHKGIKGKAIKERFLACMEFVQQQDREALRPTGTDDKPEPGEILNALEDLCSDWQPHCALRLRAESCGIRCTHRTHLLKKSVFHFFILLKPVCTLEYYCKNCLLISTLELVSFCFDKQKHF